MKKKYIIVGLIFVAILSGCAEPLTLPEDREINIVDTTVISNTTPQDIVRIELRENKISVDTNVEVIGYYTGGRAEATYSIHNGTRAGIKPNIFVSKDRNIKDYEKAYKDGYIQATKNEMAWIEIPETKEVPAGGTVEFIVAYEAPKEFEIKEDKIAFCIEVSYPDKGGQVILSVGNWWLIEMK